MEGFAHTHFIDGVVHRLAHRRREWFGHIPDPASDQPPGTFGVCVCKRFDAAIAKNDARLVAETVAEQAG
jgi:hypothetical protein